MNSFLGDADSAPGVLSSGSYQSSDYDRRRHWSLDVHSGYCTYRRGFAGQVSFAEAKPAFAWEEPVCHTFTELQYNPIVHINITYISSLSRLQQVGGVYRFATGWGLVGLGLGRCSARSCFRGRLQRREHVWHAAAHGVVACACRHRACSVHVRCLAVLKHEQGVGPPSGYHV